MPSSNTPRKRRRVRGSAMVKGAIGLTLIAGLAAGGYALTRSDGLLGGSGVTLDPTHLVSSQVQGFDITATATGELEAKRQIEIKNPLDTRSTIAEIVDEGTTVKQGDVLIRLNTDEMETKLREERLSVISARNDYEQAVGSLEIQKSENDSLRDQAELTLELAELALKRWREGEVAKRREELRVAFENAQRQYTRLEQKKVKSDQLLAQGFTSQDEHDQLVIDLARSKADLTIARLDREIYETYQYPEDEKTKLSDVSKAKAELNRTLQQNRINLANKQAAVETRQEQLRLREERLAELEEQVQAATIKAPSDGLVVYGTTLESNRWNQDEPLDVGTEVRPGELLIALPDTSVMAGSVQVHESLASRVRPGQKARIRVEAVDGEFTGTVRSIGVLAESGGWMDRNNRQYTVKVDIPPGQPGLELVKPSMRCDARIILDEVDPTLTVPIQSVFSDGAVRYVCVPTPEGLRRKPVMVGKRSDSHAQILKGLDEGTQVLVREPRSGELIDEDWSDEELAEAGYTRHEETGDIIVARSEGDQGGRRSGRAMRTRGQSHRTDG